MESAKKPLVRTHANLQGRETGRQFLDKRDPFFSRPRLAVAKDLSSSARFEMLAGSA
jgi:hypothetical protein